MSTCNSDLLRDYAFDEVPAADRPALQRHISECASCAAELDRLRLTTAALRVLPDREPPQRIAFVSDKVFAPWRLWNFAPWLGFASAGVMAAVLMVDIYHRPTEIRTVAVQSPSSAAPVQPVEEIVKRVQAEDARIFRAALAEAEGRHRRELLNLTEAIGVMQAHQNARLIETEAAGQ
jgi:anti-sigma factor RsiW